MQEELLKLWVRPLSDVTWRTMNTGSVNRSEVTERRKKLLRINELWWREMSFSKLFTLHILIFNRALRYSESERKSIQQRCWYRPFWPWRSLLCSIFPEVMQSSDAIPKQKQTQLLIVQSDMLLFGSFLLWRRQCIHHEAKICLATASLSGNEKHLKWVFLWGWISDIIVLLSAARFIPHEKRRLCCHYHAGSVWASLCSYS